MNVIVKLRVAALVLVVLALAGPLGCRHNKKKRQAPAASPDYSIVLVIAANGNREWRLYRESHHFMTVIITNEAALAIRPHPGTDPNGWGSTLYMMPFLPGATLRGARVNALTPRSDGILVSASGLVSRGAGATFGSWSWTMRFMYDGTRRKVSGVAASYSISLDGPLTALTGDLNLYRIASNYLDNVPLLDSGVGDTGDTERTDYERDTDSSSWDPPDGNTFPLIPTQKLRVNALGWYNQVDTRALGFDFQIAPAYKPSLQVTMWNITSAIIPMIFGAIYPGGASAQDPFADNVGITPVVLQPFPETEYRFVFTFQSLAQP